MSGRQNDWGGLAGAGAWWGRRLREDLAGRFEREDEGSLLDWGRRYLAAHFSRAPSGMHRWLAAELERQRTERGCRLNVIGPRGGAKSTLVTLAHVLRESVEGREPYVWIVSESRQQAQAHLENLRHELTANRALRGAYPAAVKGLWARGQGLRLGNGVAIEAYGTGQRIRGRRYREHRPSLIVCDDLQSDAHVQSAALREWVQRWFEGTLLRAGSGVTNVVHLATALHREALACRLRKTPGWKSRVFPAIGRWPEASGLWDEWEQLYTENEQEEGAAKAREFFERHRAEMEAGAELLWPEVFGLYELMQMRCESGRTTFAREMQGQPLDQAASEWPERYFGDTIWFDEWPGRLAVKVMALDPNRGSARGRGDFAGLVVLGIDGRGVCWVEAELARWTSDELVQACANWMERHRPTAFGIEANQFQELLGVLLTQELRRRGDLSAALWSLENRVNKLARIRRLGPLLAQGRLRFLRGSTGTRRLVEQLREFPWGDHDDGPDALEMAVRLAAELRRAPPDDGLGQRLEVG